MSSLARFKPISNDPRDSSGVATFTHGRLSCNAVLLSQEHAQQLAAFIDQATQQAKEEGQRAARQFMRGAINSLEGGTC